MRNILRNVGIGERYHAIVDEISKEFHWQP